MGVDTTAKLRGKILPEEILNFIRQTIDGTATMDISHDKWKHGNSKADIKDVYGDSDDWLIDRGFILFDYNGMKTSIFYHYSNTNFYENLDYYEPLGLADMVKAETTWLCMSKTNISAMLMKMIVKNFGGWIDEDDCDDIPYYYIGKDSDPSLQPVQFVTMEEIYEKFGRVVVIKK